VTRERWAQIGITAQFLIVVRTLGEFFRIRHVLATSFSAAVAAPYVGGALIAACFCWAGVTLYFFLVVSGTLHNRCSPAIVVSTCPMLSMAVRSSHLTFGHIQFSRDFQSLKGFGRSSLLSFAVSELVLAFRPVTLGFIVRSNPSVNSRDF
jgi:hypothetical protein